MKKLLKIILLFSSLLLCLCSCEHTLAVDVGSNGGVVRYEYSVSKNIADAYFGEDIPERLKDCEMREIEGEIYYVYAEELEATSYDELESLLCGIELYREEGMNLFKSADVGADHVCLTVNPCVTEDLKTLAAAQSIEVSEVASVDLVLNMPSRIVEYTCGELSEDGRTVRLTIEGFEQEERITVWCEKGTEQFTWMVIGICAAVGVTVLVGVLFIIRIRRKRAEAMPNISIDFDNLKN